MRNAYNILVRKREGKRSFENLGIDGDNIVKDLINALPGNSSVYTVQYATIDETGFPTSSAPRPVLVTDQ
jgi:hypothetical protein